jgi:hypothetical protein
MGCGAMVGRGTYTNSRSDLLRNAWHKIRVAALRHAAHAIECHNAAQKWHALPPITSRCQTKCA